MPLIGLPRLKMIARREQVEAGLRRHLAGLDKLRHRELFVPQHEADQLLAVQCAIALLRAGGGGIGLAHGLRRSGPDPDIRRREQRAGSCEQLPPARGKADFSVHTRTPINANRHRTGRRASSPKILLL